MRGVEILDTPGSLEANRKNINLTQGIKHSKEYEPYNLDKSRSDPGREKEKEVSGQQICNRSEG